jgi:hypothetical protein
MTWNLALTGSYNNIGIVLRTGFMYESYNIGKNCKAICTNLLHGPVTTQILARNQKKLELYRMFIPNPTYSRFDSNSCETPTYTHRMRTQNCASKKLLQCVVIFWPHHTSHISLFGWQGQGQGRGQYRARARAISG